MFFPQRALHDYALTGEVPEFVKSAEVVTDEEVRGLSASAFADESRKLPTHTKAATWLSALTYFRSPEGAWDEKTRDRLVKAAQFWGIEDEVWKVNDTLKMATAIPEMNDTDFAVVVKDGDETVERRFSLLDGSSVKKAAEGLEDARDRYPLAIRKEAAKRILSRARSLGVSLDNLNYIQKAAGIGVTAVEDLMRALRVRKHQAKSAEVREKIQEWGRKFEDLIDTRVVTGEPLEKLAEFLDTVDRQERLYQVYKRGVSTPEEICYQDTLSDLEKAAANTVLRDGTPFDFSSLDGIPSEQFAALGDDFIEAIDDGNGNVDVEKAAAVIPTLPIDDTSVFKKSLAL